MTRALCRYARRRFESTHGGVTNQHTFTPQTKHARTRTERPQHNTHTHTHTLHTHITHWQDESSETGTTVIAVTLTI